MRFSIVALVLGAVTLVQAQPQRPSLFKWKTHKNSDDWWKKLATNDHGGLYRLEWVDQHLMPGDKLVRSSAPYYQGHDGTHRITEHTIRVLKDQRIQHVISLNSVGNKPEIREFLNQHCIGYTSIPVEDFHTPTFEQLLKGYLAFTAHRKGTMVWCGYGHGRTGTMVTALQIWVEIHERGNFKPFTADDYRKNHVETFDQMVMLNSLQRRLLPDEFKDGVKDDFGLTLPEQYGPRLVSIEQELDDIKEDLSQINSRIQSLSVSSGSLLVDDMPLASLLEESYSLEHDDVFSLTGGGPPLPNMAALGKAVGDSLDMAVTARSEDMAEMAVNKVALAAEGVTKAAQAVQDMEPETEQAKEQPEVLEDIKLRSKVAAMMAANAVHSVQEFVAMAWGKGKQDAADAIELMKSNLVRCKVVLSHELDELDEEASSLVTEKALGVFKKLIGKGDKEPDIPFVIPGKKNNDEDKEPTPIVMPGKTLIVPMHDGIHMDKSLFQPPVVKKPVGKDQQEAEPQPGLPRNSITSSGTSSSGPGGFGSSAVAGARRKTSSRIAKQRKAADAYRSLQNYFRANHLRANNKSPRPSTSAASSASRLSEADVISILDSLKVPASLPGTPKKTGDKKDAKSSHDALLKQLASIKVPTHAPKTPKTKKKGSTKIKDWSLLSPSLSSPKHSPKKSPKKSPQKSPKISTHFKFPMGSPGSPGPAFKPKTPLSSPKIGMRIPH